MTIEEKYQCGYDTYDQAVEQCTGESIDNLSDVYWAARFAARRVTIEMARWVHDTFDLTDEQKEELHSLMCHVGSD